MYCRSCFYKLVGLPAGVCPECSAPFDPADPASYAPRLPRLLVRGCVAGLVAAVLLGLLAFGLFRMFSSMTFASRETALVAHFAGGLPLGVVGAAYAGWSRSWIARGAVLPVCVLCVWATLVLGVDAWFRTWQSMPNAPDEAFSDAGAMVPVLLGWAPAGVVVGGVFVVTWQVVRALESRRSGRVGSAGA